MITWPCLGMVRGGQIDGDKKSICSKYSKKKLNGVAER